MATDLFPLEDDEPLFGAVARYAREMRVGNWDPFLRQLFGYRAQFSPALAYNLGFVAQQVRAVWGKSSRELIESATLYPFYASFATPSQTARLYAEIEVRHAGRIPTFMLKLIQQAKMVRYCDDCVAGDRAVGRPLHWRRVHQIPGVVVCPTHGTWLRALHYQWCSTTPWPTIEEALLSGKVLEFPLTAAQWSNLHRVALAAQQLLEAGGSVDTEWLQKFCWAAAHSSGFALGRNQLAARGLTDAFVSFYGMRYLRFVGLFPARPQNWVIARLSRHQTATCALPNVLLGVFGAALESTHENSTWPYCPSTLASHGPAYRVEGRKVHDGRFYASCRCGFSFHYRDVQQGVPGGVTPTVYGPDYAREARFRFSLGQSIAAIAQALGIAETTARRITHDSSAEVTPNRVQAIDAMIEGWRRTVATGGSRGTSRADPGSGRLCEDSPRTC